MPEIDTFNKHLVSVAGDGIMILNPPRGPLTNDDALLLAAWLVSLADRSGRFADVLAAVQNT